MGGDGFGESGRLSALLGIDLGTSSVKAVLLDIESRALIGTASETYPIDKPAPDRAEQDPRAWWSAVIRAVRRVITETARVDINAIGLSGQMHGTVLLDVDHVPLHPAIIWADQRSGVHAATMPHVFGRDPYVTITGTLPAAGFMGATLTWLRSNDPALLGETRHVIFPKDYVRLKLTGEIGTDVTDAAGSGIFDITRKDWSWLILHALNLPTDMFPRVYASDAVAGFLTRAAADALGIAPGIPVVYGCADQPAQALGNGLIAPGRGSITVGSGGQVFAPMRVDLGEAVKTDARLHVFNHAVADTVYALGAVLCAGLSLHWLRGILGWEDDPGAYARLSAEAALIPPRADGLIFLPYLMGERTPHFDPNARGGFIGLSSAHTRGHMARAVMEGVAFALKQAFDLCTALTGDVHDVVASGGGMESDVWRGIMADVVGVPLLKSRMVEQAGTGAALLAGVGVGVWKSFDEACSDVVRLGSATEPNRVYADLYAEQYARYVKLYPRLKDFMGYIPEYGGLGRAD